MTNTGRLVCLMADGKIWTAAEIGEAMGIDSNAVTCMTGHMRRRGELTKPQATAGYLITPKGKARADSINARPKWYAERLEREYRQNRAKARDRAPANLPIVQQAQLLSPVSVWAYAERAAA